VPALGDYAAPMSTKLFASRDQHSTERADLRGQRLLIAEELTDDCALNVTAIKQITDVSMIRARHIRKDNFTFQASHSIFITTNYVPIVRETDHGTWRRIALVVFPFTFRKAGETLAVGTDRRGDSGLKARLRSGRDGQHDAIVTWAVEGARRWYATGVPALPDQVDADTRAWRKQSDHILGFWADGPIVADPTRCVLTTDVFQAFNAWLMANGHPEWPKERFHPRFKSHDETRRHHVGEGRTTKLDGLSRPSHTKCSDPSKQALVYRGIRFLTPSEFEQDTRGVAELADPLLTSPGEVFSEIVRNGSARSAICCGGAELLLRCKLCPRSPTYWQRDSEVPR
jgi:putative DNA primase/helicase